MTSLASYFQDGDPDSWALIVDTSSKEGALQAINKDFEVLFNSTWYPPEKHTDLLIKEFLKLKKHLSLINMSFIIFVNGPGSFTGLRVGAAFAKSLSLANTQSPIVAVSSFLPAAYEVTKKDPALNEFSICIPSIGDQFFRSDFKRKKNLTWDESIQTKGAQTELIYENRNFSVDSNLTGSFSEIKPIKKTHLSLIESLQSLKHQGSHTKVYTHLDLYPLYLRKSEAEEKYRYDKLKI